ncbi:alpha-galactosidase [Rathayibacter oskolensis]|uniref:Alpha-galactosidase n=1 Tax=Rathayibacter oskolensis TaxID=1891671 RepID=A0A1X7PEZ5_9MICO|nr:alpha-galactosidase [Rathayibacter oskolensis]SMH49038.1 alpha-galactosidase [Rathayibacter oskolensis]
MTPPRQEEPSIAPTTAPRLVRLAAGGVSVIVEIPRDSLPRIVHWGADAGDLADDELRDFARAVDGPNAANGVDVAPKVALVPEAWTGWTGTPGLRGHRLGEGWSPRFVPTSVENDDLPAGGGVLVVESIDQATDLSLTLRLELLATGLLRARAAVTNLAASPYIVDGLDVALPVPGNADELLDFAGRWSKERIPQRSAFQVGARTREGRHGRTGADAAFLLTAGEPGFDFRGGEVWGLHVAFSGNHRSVAERIFTGERLLLGGESLLPGEIVLQQDETYTAPWIYGVYGVGLDDAAARVHGHLRARDTHPTSPRPVVMNVWEAVYFDHDLDRLTGLADLAAQVGVERFVLDDGWFGARRDDTAGLGDWVLAEEVWGGGRFRALVDHVQSLGMQFGLWVEPEMVNLDSDLARAHPEWLLQVAGRLPVEARHQQVLDLTHEGAFRHVRHSISALVREYGISFLKWDHNRDLIDAGSTRTGRPGVHEQTLATYRLLDELRATLPGLEIESCSSGGARVDLEILERTDRVWASDCIDAHERQHIQRWTQQLLPPELVGSHVGSLQAHTTGRRLDLDFRAATALFGHFGIEWDLGAATEQEREALAEWVALYKRHRSLLHAGTVIRDSSEDDALWLHGAVSADRHEALYAVTLLERTVTWPARRIRLPGLDAGTRYRVTPAGPGAQAPFDARVHPAWWSAEGVTLRGALLGTIGIEVPALDPDHSALVHVTAVR